MVGTLNFYITNLNNLSKFSTQKHIKVIAKKMGHMYNIYELVRFSVRVQICTLVVKKL